MTIRDVKRGAVCGTDQRLLVATLEFAWLRNQTEQENASPIVCLFVVNNDLLLSGYLQNP